jgi:hypothetical protein
MELHVADAGRFGEVPRCSDCLAVPVEADGVLRARGEPQRDPSGATAHVEGALALEPLGGEQRKEARRNGHATPP